MEDWYYSRGIWNYIETPIGIVEVMAEGDGVFRGYNISDTALDALKGKLEGFQGILVPIQGTIILKDDTYVPRIRTEDEDRPAQGRILDVKYGRCPLDHKHSKACIKADYPFEYSRKVTPNPIPEKCLKRAFNH